MKSNADKRLGIILLGAGNSKRFGGRKQFLEIDGEMMYQKMMRKLALLPNTKKVLVTQFPEMEEDAMGYGFMVVRNPEPERGISSSIRLGIEALYKGEEEPFLGILFGVCDQPYVTADSLKRLYRSYQEHTNKIVCLSYQGEMGNPVIFHTDYKEELLQLSGDVGGKKVVKNHMEEVLLVEVANQRELFDIDEKQDIEKKA